MAATAALLALATACGGRTPPATPAPDPAPFPGAAAGGGGGTPPPAPPMEPLLSDEPPISVGRYDNKTPQEINEDSPFVPVFFAYDSDELDDTARQALAQNAGVLRQYGTWVLTIEGHCDERGTAEYNLALGDRRALAAKSYLQSLGIPAERLRTVSYGKEFPFDPGHDEAAWSKNRRAHFMVTSR
jgi:peptidoglycan-associated lipoprotein